VQLILFSLLLSSFVAVPLPLTRSGTKVNMGAGMCCVVMVLLTSLSPGAKHDPSEYFQALRIRSVAARLLLIILIPPCFS
jgi:hypothetical protein